jgi:hypothetical protein
MGVGASPLPPMSSVTALRRLLSEFIQVISALGFPVDVSARFPVPGELAVSSFGGFCCLSILHLWGCLGVCCYCLAP